MLAWRERAIFLLLPVFIHRIAHSLPFVFPFVLSFLQILCKQQNSNRNCLSSRLTQQPTAASADPPPSDAKRESKPSPESTEQKMEKLGQASSKNASASTRSQEDDCMNENGKNAKTPVRASPEHPHQVMPSKL